MFMKLNFTDTEVIINLSSESFLHFITPGNSYFSFLYFGREGALNKH